MGLLRDASVMLTSIAMDAGTQIRLAISDDVVARYAERMAAGDLFPPVVLFFDGTRHFLADGFHRCHAVKRLGGYLIRADVRNGTRSDALWFALAANRANAHQLTAADKQHAIELALQTWPNRSTTQIADHVGCAQSYVMKVKSRVITSDNPATQTTGKDGKQHPSRRLSDAERAAQDAEILRRLRAGDVRDEIAKALHVDKNRVGAMKRTLAQEMAAVPKNARSAVEARREQMKQLASEGHSTHQIAARVGMSFHRCRYLIHKLGIDVPADRAIGKARRHNANRIVSQMVMDAEHLTADVVLIQFSALDAAQLPIWIDSLKKSRRALDVFITRLTRERRPHEAA